MRIEQLTFTRFIAAVAIVVFHDGLDVFPFHLPVLHSLFQSAFTGVSYFFILSGFVMVVAYAGKSDQGLSYREYYTNRFARIYPAYGMALLMVIVIFLVSGKAVDLLSAITGFFLVQSWIPGYAATLNVPGWSLSVELFFYIVFPLLFNALYRTPGGRYTAMLMALAVWLVTQVVSIGGVNWFASDPVTQSILYYSPWVHINEFLIGNAFACFFMYHQESSRYKNYDGAIIAAVAMTFVFFIYNPGWNSHNGLLALFFLPLILLLSYNTGYLTRLFRHPVAVVLGEISFGIYIYQKPVKYGFYKLCAMIGLSQKELCFYGFLVFLILFSYGSYRFLEQPLRRLIQRRYKARWVIAPVAANK